MCEFLIRAGLVILCAVGAWVVLVAGAYRVLFPFLDYLSDSYERHRQAPDPPDQDPQDPRGD